MSKKGFYIKSIISTGDGMLTSKVVFHDGCNLLFGPSEKGKSTVFSIIEYMLGSSSTPKDVNEALGYTDYYMEFVTYQDNITHTAYRNIGATKVIVKDCPYEQYNTEMAVSNTYPLKSNGKITYSSYLMGLNGYSSNLQLKSGKNSKAKMSFAWARHLFLVSENRVVSDNPIFIPENDSNTKEQEKSFLHYLITGQDDSSFTVNEDEKIRRSRFDGMIVLANESLDYVNTKIVELGDVSFVDFKDEKIFEELQGQIKLQEKKLNILYEQRLSKEEDIREQKSKLLFAKEFVKRMTILKNHYTLDLQRYEHLYEGLSLMIPLTEKHICPICHSNIDSCEIDDNYKKALEAEYSKTQAKLNDIEKVISAKNDEMGELEYHIQSTEGTIGKIRKSIQNFEPQIINLKAALLKYQENIEKKVYSTFLQDEVQRLNKQIADLQKRQKAKPKNSNYARESSIDRDFCNSIKTKLLDWNVIGDVPIVYNEAEFDFSIGGQKRTMSGKGKRGVTCTAIMMTLIEFCKQKEIPFSQILVVDSPLTAHFNDERVDVDSTTQARFFNYCNKTAFDYQLILIDNKAPSATEREKMNGIHFIEFSERNRNGFYLGKAITE